MHGTVGRWLGLMRKSSVYDFALRKQCCMMFSALLSDDHLLIVVASDFGPIQVSDYLHPTQNSKYLVSELTLTTLCERYWAFLGYSDLITSPLSHFNEARLCDWPSMAMGIIIAHILPQFNVQGERGTGGRRLVGSSPAARRANRELPVPKIRLD